MPHCVDRKAAVKTRRGWLRRLLSEEPCPDAAEVVADPSRRRGRCRARFPARALRDSPPAPRLADAGAACALRGYLALRRALRPYRPEIRYSCAGCGVRPPSARRRQFRPADGPYLSAWHCPLCCARTRRPLSQASCQGVALPRASGCRNAFDVSTNDLSFIAIRIATRAGKKASHESAVE